MPFAGVSWAERSANITRARYDYKEFVFNEVSDVAKDFVDHLLVRRPDQRMSATKALHHKWILEGPLGKKPNHMNTMRHNLKSYMADYRSRWQRAGNVMIAAHRFRMKTPQESTSRNESSGLLSEGEISGNQHPSSRMSSPELPFIEDPVDMKL